MRFSSRTDWDLEETALTEALRIRSASGLPVLDLTASNPTRCGFDYDESAILAPLASSKTLIYEPDPRGMLSARESVAGYYARAGAAIPPRRIFLTTSTSEAYSYLFRLLCDPGEEVLIAQPSYPLFDFLAQLDDIRLVPYPLFYDHGWHLDLEAVRQRITPRTKAIVLVHPNNPTGHFTKACERRELEALCTKYGLALIVDEVFLDYPLPGHAAISFATAPHPALTFVLSGLSKIAALPQMKSAWIAAAGPEPALTQALNRLEVIADTFLSMNAPIQHALPAWLESRGHLQHQIARRTQANLKALDEILRRQTMISRLEVEAGWYAVLRIPALEPDEQLAVRLVRDYGISVHPGYFFGFSGQGWLVVSLLTPETVLCAGIQSICNIFNRLNVEP
jgi:aspartate/methionine/tyrosine aminotransferase